MELYKFIKHSKPDHLTLGEVKKLKPGDQLDVIIWDRNFEEYQIWNEFEPEKAYAPKYFFGKNRHTLVYKGDMKWDLHYGDAGIFEHPVHLDTSSLPTYWKWVELSDEGYVDINNEMLSEGQTIPKDWKRKHIHWSEFPDSTRVGWRGPIMLWEKLGKYTNVFYNR